MGHIHFQHKLEAYAEWRGELIEAIGRYQSWLEKYEFNNSKVNESILNMLQNLKADRITLAFAAEFSRGKTELINALFFSETGVRLLPSAPGRTTMCPTEIFYDPEGGSYLRLLSIESRLNDSTLSEYKAHPKSWMQIDLDPESPIQMQEAFQELLAVKRVSLDEARKLGLYHEAMHPDRAIPPESVEIPCWRHALISFPHYLLKDGLALLDTPGLNALGTEPELTLNMLPNAQAVLFVLAADTGVTQSDLAMWQNHVLGSRPTRRRGLIVVMNKIDTLWDDLQGDESTEKSIRSQVNITAQVLKIEQSVIFPVSAKQALLAKVKGDDDLLEKSRLKALEKYLAEEMLKERRQILMQAVEEGIGQLVRESVATVTAHADALKRQLENMQKIGAANASVIKKLMNETRDEQSRYLSSAENFQASRRVFSVQARLLIDALSPERTDKMIKKARKQMQESLTTLGMKGAMKKVFDELSEALLSAAESTEEARRLVKAIYNKFQEDHGFRKIKPKLFSIKKYQLELEQLFAEGEAFRNSVSSTLMEQNLVVQKLQNSIFNRVRDLLQQAHKEVNTWSAVALTPLVYQIKDHKKLIEQRLEMLRKVNESKKSLHQDILVLKQELKPLQKQQDELLAIASAMGLDTSLFNQEAMGEGEPLPPRAVMN